MGLFIEVDSIEKNCKVIINLDMILEIAPMAAGGCTLFFQDSASVGGKNSMKVRDSFNMFKQFALQTVSEEDIRRRINSLSGQKNQANEVINLSPTKAKKEKPGFAAAAAEPTPE
jgi:hypothetical protein